jgi:hypothetical protein
MLTLIRREIHDNLIYVLGACAISLMMIGMLIYTFLRGISAAALPSSLLLMPALFIGFTVLGAAQMCGDRANRISPLLSTLAVTRDGVLAARVLAGVLALLTALVPVIITAVILLRMFVPPFEFYRRMVVEIAATITLMSLACYCAGLLVGWTTSRTWLILGSLLLMVLSVSIIGAKGFGPVTMLILLVLIAAMLVHTRHKFTSASL